MREVYMDNAATTPLDSEVLNEMMPYFTDVFGNPGSLHNKGLQAKDAVTKARILIARNFNCQPEEIIFTGSGTESDNLAVMGYARKNKDKGKHIITSTIEHHAVLDAFDKLEKEGFKVTRLKVNGEGLVAAQEFEKAIRKDTILASICYANNEIGVIQDIKTLSGICRKHKVAFHTDACQAANYLTLDVKELGVDLMTINGSKIYGPKGTGVLFKSKNIQIEPIVFGGGQEGGIRSGTENVPGIVGIAKALEIAQESKSQHSKQQTELRDYLIKELLKIPETKLNGHKTQRLPNNVNISFLNIEGESILLKLNEEGIYASTGSACTSTSLDPSHVILALGLPHELGHSSIRFSIGKATTKDDIDYVLQKVTLIVNELRQASPLRRTLSEVLAEAKVKQ